MNRRQRQLLTQIFQDPAPANLRWTEIESLLRALGVEVHERSGSRVLFVLNGVRAVFHRPHPRPEAKRGAVRAVRDFLTAAGILPGAETDDA
jgi:hypothetical protein